MYSELFTFCNYFELYRTCTHIYLIIKGYLQMVFYYDLEQCNTALYGFVQVT